MSNTTSPSKGKVAIPGLLDMLKAGVHFGHMTSKWHPKMQRFIFTSRSGVHIINLEATRQKLEEALGVISDTVAKGGTVLFVGSKKQIQEDVKKIASSVNMPYVHERWIGGLLTNFGIISKMIKRHRELGQIIETENYGDRTKKERLELTREHKRLNDVIGGISSLDKIPDLIFLVDVRREKTAVREAKNVGVPIVGICDTNTNPELVQYPIPANDDAVGSVQMMLNLAAEAVKQGQARQATEMVRTVAPQLGDKKAEVIKKKVEAKVS
jgi:small subunit ribosomal protein S2